MPRFSHSAYCFVNIQTVKNTSIVRNIHFFIVYLDKSFYARGEKLHCSYMRASIILSADLTDDYVLCFGEFIATQ